MIFNVLLLTGISLQNAYSNDVFEYDQAVMSKAKPWTSENFKNNPDNFQFAIIGDRTGGANVQGTFKLAMDQLNLLQPEFVINVGDIIEGYADSKNELVAMWEEAEALTGKLQMPFFYTRGNHDVSFPGGIDEMLKDRGFTFFAGHLHYYDYDNINGHEYITIGPAGASWHHEGPGNVDHITWVTMTDDGPQIGNIALKGIFDRKGLDPSLFGAYDRKGAVKQILIALTDRKQRV